MEVLNDFSGLVAKDQTGVAAVVSFLIKVYTYEKPRVDQSFNVKPIFLEKGAK
jgi:hypothetical protein